MIPDSPELAVAKRLLDTAKNQGFRFQRVGLGEDGPLWGLRETVQWRDEIYLAGWSGSCHAVRKRHSQLVVPGGLPVVHRVEGDALTVLRAVVCWAW